MGGVRPLFPFIACTGSTLSSNLSKIDLEANQENIYGNEDCCLLDLDAIYLCNNLSEKSPLFLHRRCRQQFSPKHTHARVYVSYSSKLKHSHLRNGTTPHNNRNTDPTAGTSAVQNRKTALRGLNPDSADVLPVK